MRPSRRRHSSGTTRSRRRARRSPPPPFVSMFIFTRRALLASRPARGAQAAQFQKTIGRVACRASKDQQYAESRPAAAPSSPRRRRRPGGAPCTRICSRSERTSESSAWAALKSSAKVATRWDSSGSKPNLSSLLRSAALVDSRSFNKTFAGEPTSTSVIVVVPCRDGRYVGLGPRHCRRVVATAWGLNF